MIKTLDKSEFQVLSKILVDYYNYILQYPDTRLVKFYALYGIKMYGHLQYVVVMNNLFFDEEKGIPIRPIRKYDLKGSMLYRLAETKTEVDIDDYFDPPTRNDSGYSPSTGEREIAPPIPGSSDDLYEEVKLPTLKDGNWNDKMYIAEEKVPQHLRQLARDCAFLRDHNLMDYSLLLGIVLDKKISDPSMSSTKITLEGEYVFGIIDILQEWNWKKRGEQLLKRIFWGHWREYKKLSAVEPEYYSRRFALRVLGSFHYDKAKKKKNFITNFIGSCK